MRCAGVGGADGAGQSRTVLEELYRVAHTHRRDLYLSHHLSPGRTAESVTLGV